MVRKKFPVIGNLHHFREAKARAECARPLREGLATIRN
jgi:hypothetical protein